MHAGVASGARAEPGAAAPARRAAIERGRAVGRTIVGFEYPAMCAIPVLVARCRADFDTFVGTQSATFDRVPELGPGALGRMRTYFADGDLADYDHGFATIRSATAPRALLVADPGAAWAMDAGIVDETAPAALHGSSLVFSTPPVGQMILHFSAAGADAAIFPGGHRPVTPPEIAGATPSASEARFPAAIIDQLPAGVDARYPAYAVPALPFGTGDRGDVVAGIGFATVLQMCDTPAVAALPESQQFFDDFVGAASHVVTANGGRMTLAQTRADLRAAADPTRVAHAERALEKLEEGFARATLRRVLIGQFTSQLAFNATIARDRTFATAALRDITQWNDADGAYPGLRARRAALALVDPGDQRAQRRAAMALLGFLTIPPAAPVPESSP